MKFISWIKKNYIFASPFLIALYTVVFLYSKNIGEYTEDTIIVPILISLFVSAAAFLLARILLRNSQSAAFVSAYIVFATLSYVRILAIAQNNSFFALTGIFLLACVVVYISIKYKKSLKIINKTLILAAFALLVFSTIPIISFEIKTQRIFSYKEKLKDVKVVGSVDKNLPDIYYFIFDRYAGPGSTTKEYGFDNSNFINALGKSGFYVAKSSTTNYPKTFLSLASTFNMDYLDVLTEKTNGGASPDESLATPYIREGEALKFLKSKGYTLVNIGPKTWTPTSNNPFADRNFVMSQSTYPYADIFTTGYLNTTIAAPIIKRLWNNPIDVSEDPNNNEHRKVVLYELDAVRASIKIPGPKFVFVHILLPHDPFVFDKNCSPISEKVVSQNSHVTNYINQLQCANTQILNLISDVLSQSETKPVVIIQSDEGPFPMKDPVSQDQAWINATNTALHEKFPILNAYFFPNASTDNLYQTITPVNSFRVLFNTYFNTRYPLLEDKNYIFQDGSNYYKFIDITDKVKE